MTDHPLPHSLDAERAILGSVLLAPACWHRLPADLNASSFYDDRHAAIFAAIAELIHVEGARLEDIGSLLVCETLKQRKTPDGKSDMLAAIGGKPFVSCVIDDVPDFGHFERSAAIVIEHARKRALFALGHALASAVTEGGSTSDDATAATLAALAGQSMPSEQARPLGDVVAEAFARQRTLATAGKSVSFESGWDTMDDHRVFSPTLVLCTADRGHGKSAVMIEWSTALAQHGHGNVMFSLESAPKEIGLRWASQDSGIPHRRMRDWRMFNDGDNAKVAESQRVASGLNVFVDRGPWTLEGICRETRRLRAVHKIDCAFIDYMQLVQSAGAFEREELRLGYAAQKLLQLALELEMCIVVMSQVNEQGEVSNAKSIEKAARVRVHFERPGKDDENTAHAMIFRILKNNEERTHMNGFAGHFDEPYLRVREGTCDSGQCSLKGTHTEKQKTLY